MFCSLRRTAAEEELELACTASVGMFRAILEDEAGVGPSNRVRFLGGASGWSESESDESLGGSEIEIALPFPLK